MTLFHFYDITLTTVVRCNDSSSCSAPVTNTGGRHNDDSFPTARKFCDSSQAPAQIDGRASSRLTIKSVARRSKRSQLNLMRLTAAGRQHPAATSHCLAVVDRVSSVHGFEIHLPLPVSESDVDCAYKLFRSSEVI